MSLTTVENGTVPRIERRDHGPVIRDLIIGFADGLTVPFALTAGLSSLGSSKLVIVAGLADLVSGAISMGLGAYLATTTERERFLHEHKLELAKLINQPEDEKQNIYVILSAYGVSREAARALVVCLERDVELWIKFVMDFDLKPENQTYKRAWISAGTMGMSYFLGGLIPMVPYFAFKQVQKALFVSIGITVVILLVFGWIKTFIFIKSQRSALMGALQTLVIGVVAAGASYGIVKGIESSSIAG